MTEINFSAFPTKLESLVWLYTPINTRPIPGVAIQREIQHV